MLPSFHSFSSSLLQVSSHIIRRRAFSQTRIRTLSMLSESPPEATTSQATFPISPIPKNPLGEGRYIRTAAALIIGDEILNGKTLDRNSNYFARYCFEQGVELQRIEVISDDENQIIEASRRMVRNYDFVITSGGIGPTHDDITYASLAKSFNQSLIHHTETLKRMEAMSRTRKWNAQRNTQQNAEQRTAYQRMALFPENAEVIFVGTDIWVPVVRLEGKLCILPGIPTLFQRMLTGLTPFLPLPPVNERPMRIQVFTDRPESMIAPYLTTLQKEVKPNGIQIGSYPVMGKGVFVSLIGKKARARESEAGDASGEDYLMGVARDVERQTGGKIVSDEEVAQKKEEARESRLQTSTTLSETPRDAKF
ncbi:MoaB/Mog domain-containing protein [Collybia nuda]|uniref:MoaB/Mog domain-containing protein n=1 Tax=Collybia nuda TaxID=64659 RepID=A0A9P5YFL6_9AGAR|nr:MoaB/Mog domain-containing protein [Collybia nuda]